MSARPVDHTAARAKAIHLWNTEPEMSSASIAERLSLDSKLVGSWIREAMASGATQRMVTSPPVHRSGAITRARA